MSYASVAFLEYATVPVLLAMLIPGRLAARPEPLLSVVTPFKIEVIRKAVALDIARLPLDLYL